MTKSASEELEKPYKGEQEAGSEEESERVSSLSSADLQAATSWECFLHATFFMILSSDGPRTHPHLEGPPRVCEPPDISLSLSLFLYYHHCWRLRLRLTIVIIMLGFSDLVLVKSMGNKQQYIQRSKLLAKNKNVILICRQNRIERERETERGGYFPSSEVGQLLA